MHEKSRTDQGLINLLLDIDGSVHNGTVIYNTTQQHYKNFLSVCTQNIVILFLFHFISRLLSKTQHKYLIRPFI